MSKHEYESKCKSLAIHFLAQGIDKLEAARVQLEIFFHQHPEWDSMIQYDLQECLGKLAPLLSALITWDDYDDQGNPGSEKEEEEEEEQEDGKS